MSNDWKKAFAMTALQYSWLIAAGIVALVVYVAHTMKTQ